MLLGWELALNGVPKDGSDVGAAVTSQWCFVGDAVG